MEELTKQFMEYLHSELKDAENEAESKMIEIATLLAYLYLKRYPSNMGYNFRLGNNVNDIFAKFRNDIYIILEKHIQNAIKLSVLKNEKILGEKIGDVKIKNWLNDKIGKYTLKQRILKYSNMFKMEMEAHIAMGIANKENIPTFLLKVKKYLSNPYDVLTVRTKADWEARRLAVKYSSGTGTYTSAFNNFKRLFENEILTSGRMADHIIWKNNNSVRGVLISLNIAHPKVDMCDDLAGLYPKEFVFMGWHPRCICLATPILSGTNIKNIPDNAKVFMNDNKNFKWYSNLPFYSMNKKYFK